MKETERARGGDVVGGRLSHMTLVYVFSPDWGDQPLSQHISPSGRTWIIPLDLVIGIAGINRQRKRWSPNPRVWKKIPLYVESMEDDHL